MKRKRMLAAVAAVGMLGLAGCSTEPTVAPPPADQAVSGEDPAAGEADTVQEETTPPEMDATEAFGSTATWPDGVAITVGKPQPFKPSEWAAGVVAGADHVVMDVTLANGSGEPVEAQMASLRATSGDESVEQVFDSEKGVEGTTARVMPGKSTVWRVVFPKPGDDLLVTVDWGFGSPVTFE